MKILLLLFLVDSLSVAQHQIAIVGGTLIDGTWGAPVQNSVILIQGSKIIAVGTKTDTPIPKNANIIDAQGKYITPGLIDCHIHYEQPRDLVQLLAWGVTSVNCMFESTDQALAMEKMSSNDTVHSPQIYATAPIFSCKGGWWEGDGFPIDSTINRFPATPEEAREAVDKAKAKGIKRIKLMYDDMGWCRDPLPRLKTMDPAIVAALIYRTRDEELTFEVHAPIFSLAKDPLYNVSMDSHSEFSLMHGIIDDIVAPSVKMNPVTYYVPTFCVFNFLADTKGFVDSVLADQRFSSALPVATVQRYTSEDYYDHYRKTYPNISFVKHHLPILEENMRRTFDHAVNVAMGTDMWAFPGIGAHLELGYMVKAGMKPLDAIMCATLIAREFLKEPEIGTIESGQQADLLILDANPLDDIRNTRSVRTIVKHGQIFDHQQLIDESKRQ